MASLVISVAVGVLTFGLGLLGLYLKRLVPERHMSAGSRDMIGAVIGLLSLLLALVLGTLVGSAYGFFATQKGDIESLCARSLELDLAFRQYRPETQPLRQALRDSMQEALDALRGDNAAYQRHFELGGYMSKFEKWNETVSSLSPRSPMQTALVSSMSASSAIFQQTRLLMSLQLASPISWPLIVIVVSWAMLLFFGFGVTSGLNPDQSWRARFWLIRSGKRDLFDPRAQPTVLWALPDSVRTDREGHCRAGLVAAARSIASSLGASDWSCRYEFRLRMYDRYLRSPAGRVFSALILTGAETPTPPKRDC